MKAKNYILSLIAVLGFGFAAQAQCVVTITSLSATGLVVSATSSGSGALGFPVQGWDWGDATSPSTGASATHTYASAGSYNICAYYFDALDTASCFVQTCSTFVVSSVGIQQVASFEANVTCSPNPFAAATSFAVSLNQQSKVEMTVYDITGKQVAVVYNDELNAGLHLIKWTPENLAEGVYFIRMNAGGQVITKKIVHTNN